MAVNNWLKRYEKEDVKGLEIRGGRGRKAILQTKNLELVKAQVKLARQRVSLAKFELENSLEKQFWLSTPRAIFEKNGCRYKRIRKRLKGNPNAAVYQLKKEVLGEFERMSQNRLIDL